MKITEIDASSQEFKEVIGLWKYPGTYNDLISEACLLGYKYYAKWPNKKGVGIWCLIKND